MSDNPTDHDAARLTEALTLARRTAALGNVPVGALVEVDGEVVAEAANLRDVLRDPTAHAELLALRQAAQVLGRWKLPEATLYVTVEPCTMCAGAIAQARVGRLVFGAVEPKTGAVVSQFKLLDGTATEVTHVTSQQASCASVMSAFFERLRERPHPKR